MSKEETPKADVTNTTAPSGKPWYMSKRFYTTILTALLPVIPGAGEFIAAYPELYSSLLSALFGYVGIKTTQPILFKNKGKEIKA